MTNKHSRVPQCDASSSPTGNHHHPPHAASRPPPSSLCPHHPLTTPLTAHSYGSHASTQTSPNDDLSSFGPQVFSFLFFSYIFYYLINVSLNIGYKYVV